MSNRTELICQIGTSASVPFLLAPSVNKYVVATCHKVSNALAPLWPKPLSHIHDLRNCEHDLRKVEKSC